MRLTRRLRSTHLVLFCLLACPLADLLEAKDPDYARDILPILKRHCLDCHGPETAESNLRLDSPVAALRGGGSGERVINPGKSDESYLIELLTTTNPKRRMPLDAEPLKAEEIATLKRWIDAKSMWDKASSELKTKTLSHWSFQPVQRPDVPEVGENNAIDAFITARLRDKKLTRSNRADSRSLARRLSLVMHGLPPTRKQTDTANNNAADWQRIVDDTLKSPRYGERWATFWLDLVRFGETHGFETNRERPNSWFYRDWVIDSLNADKPYDQFIVEQIAGDAVGAAKGTGFLVAGPFDLVKGRNKELLQMQRQDELADMLNTTGTAFMGLTIGCARCHNHKFDPISQTDYYAMQAVFAGVQHAERALPIPKDAKKQVAKLSRRREELRDKLARFVRRAGTGRILIDDEPTKSDKANDITHLVKPAGRGTNPAGKDRGHRDDIGNVKRSPNISGGKYTWWHNHPGRDVAVYRPFVKGRYRIWLSWGAGPHTHSTNVKYLIDQDGKMETSDDRQIIATVNQQLFGDGSGEVSDKLLWSGFYDAGAHELGPRSAIVIQCGSKGQAVTADVVLLEPARSGTTKTKATKPHLRAAVNAIHNVEVFDPIKTRFVKFTIDKSSASEPCIDELEIFAGKENVALASAGAKATSGGDFVHPLHKLKHINDGEYGNAKSWIALQRSGGWVQIEFNKSQTIDRIEWARDRLKQYSDRVAVDYRIEASMDGNKWTTIASSADRLPFSSGPAPASLYYAFDSLPEAEAATGRAWLKELEQIEADQKRLSKAEMIYAGKFSQPGPTHRLYRGEPGSPREQVSPGALQSFSDIQLPKDSPEQTRRLTIAKWIANRKNPLTARVMVNRIWQYHFGTGLVDTPSDFGGNGTRPTHPQLLDWLAAEFMDNGWSIKHMHRLILTSKTWQQSSRPRETALAIDAGTRYLWRFPPRRLNAEAIRDSILSVSGKLDLRMGGAGFSPFEVQLENVRHYFPKMKFGPEDWRRMVYMTKVRQEREAVFGVFDCPDANQVVPKRSRSTTPLQALNLLNSPFMLEQAKFVVERLEKEAKDNNAKIQLAFELCYARSPSQEEIKLASDFIKQSNWLQFARAMLNSNEFVFIP